MRRQWWRYPSRPSHARCPDIPFGLDEIHFGAGGSLLFAVVVTVAIGSLVGLVVCRASGLAPTMITLAALFVVDQLVKNWDELTRGAGGLSGIPRLNSAWLWLGAFVALLIAHVFQEMRIGRFTIATREDELAAPAMGIRLFTFEVRGVGGEHGGHRHRRVAARPVARQCQPAAVHARCEHPHPGHARRRGDAHAERSGGSAPC